MTKDEFKKRWESDDNGGSLDFDDAADCAQAWGLFSRPRTSRMDVALYRVLVAAGVADAEDYNPNKENEDD